MFTATTIRKVTETFANETGDESLQKKIASGLQHSRKAAVDLVQNSVRIKKRLLEEPPPFRVDIFQGTMEEHEFKRFVTDQLNLPGDFHTTVFNDYKQLWLSKAKPLITR